jgi:hypothetical protein
MRRRQACARQSCSLSELAGLDTPTWPITGYTAEEMVWVLGDNMARPRFSDGGQLISRISSAFNERVLNCKISCNGAV